MPAGGGYVLFAEVTVEPVGTLASPQKVFDGI